MTAPTFSAQCDDVYYRLEVIRDEVGEYVKEQARQMIQVSQVVSRLEVSPLLDKGCIEFSARAIKEYENTPFLEIADLIIPSFQFYFFSDALRAEVCQILKVSLTSQNSDNTL